MTVKQILKDYTIAKGISIYQLSKLTGIRYELLRRSINENRVLSADELIAIAGALHMNLNMFYPHIVSRK